LYQVGVTKKRILGTDNKYSKARSQINNQT
jgi:hypothetical protein